MMTVTLEGAPSSLPELLESLPCGEELTITQSGHDGEGDSNVEDVVV